ncbi:MAG TPA: efflux RND transporter periplasmic adaptor subunit [Gallionella sp.]|nr:MAG: efflux transporter periplasmic adaptor subunit [Gallionellales bacterium GWA2_54_124]HCI53632.1 efflux RND transporter periplasmic adaptor subunit [Gallionella sp.]
MIKFDKRIVAVSVVVLLFVIYFSWPHVTDEGVQPVPAAHKLTDTLHFDANAPQLSFIKIAAVEAFPEPLVEPMNARIAYDDNRTARVFSPVAGRVVKILAETGRQVAKGEGILVLDSPDYAQAVADSSRADADLLRKQEAFERARLLFDAKGIARKDLENAEADSHQAEAEAARARARLNNLTGNPGRAPGQFVLVSPHAGVVSERQVSSGSEVRPDAPNPLFVITDPAHVWIQVDLPEQQMGKVSVGQAMMAQVDAYPNELFTGKITVIAGALDPATRRMQVRCEIDNLHLKLKPEMYARVWPIASVHDSLPRVPNTAIVTQGLFSYVFVEQSAGVLQRRRVTLGLQGHNESYIKEGLKVGERVVTTGALLLNAELAGID